MIQLEKTKIFSHFYGMVLVRNIPVLCFFWCITLGYSQSKYAVTFTDKKQQEYSLSRPQEFLSEASLLRRAKQHIAVTETDLPISPSYIQQLNNLGVNITHISKWLNLAVIETNDISAIVSLPFVKSITPINKNNFVVKKESDKSEILTEKAFQDFNPVKYYGAAASQNTMIRVDYLHKRGYKGDSVHIALFDAGYRNAHNIRGFDSLFADGRIMDTWDFVAANDSIFSINTGTHGTAVLSCMAANEPDKMVGTSPNASYSLYVTEDGSSETIAEEYNWLIAAEHADSIGAQLFSTSLGYTTFDNGIMNHTYADMDGKSTVITRAANAAARVGIVVVNSAGNEGNKPWHYISAPADGDSVLAVGAVNADRMLANFSSRGPNAEGRVKPDVCAQGANVAVYNPSGNIFSSNGTSFSCPIMAGAIACLMQAFPEATNMEIMNAVVQSAHLFKSPNDDYGYGIPDMAIAFWILNEIYPKVNRKNNVLAYPNPFSNKLYIYLAGETSENLTIELFDMTGKLALSSEISSPTNDHFFEDADLSALREGVYLLRIKGESVYEVMQIVKQ